MIQQAFDLALLHHRAGRLAEPRRFTAKSLLSSQTMPTRCTCSVSSRTARRRFTRGLRALFPGQWRALGQHPDSPGNVPIGQSQSAKTFLGFHAVGNAGAV
jgi:hypothetical protein